MNIPAIRAKIGVWEYYVATLTFEQVATYVLKIYGHLHKSEGLKDLIQRSITSNYISIKEYIIGQPEVFFNSLVLAVYDDYPNWREIEFKYNEIETYQMGLLEFPGNHKIFPVDGQHRVEGIKEALKTNPQLKNERVAAIFIGHKNSEEGREKTRRLFTTLNRYAKPVSLDDIIALDEDDSVAICTRKLLEEYSLFTGKRVIYAAQKAIPSTNKTAITSIITLYQANIEILKAFLKEKTGKKQTKVSIEKYLKFRPSVDELAEFQDFVLKFWDNFKNKLTAVSDYVSNDENLHPASTYRDNENGGNLIFRPIGFLPLVKAALKIYAEEGIDFSIIFERFNELNFNINSTPWLYVLWNPVDKKMVMSSDKVTYLLMLYLYNPEILSAKETLDLKKGYAAKISFEEDVDNVLDDIL